MQCIGHVLFRWPGAQQCRGIIRSVTLRCGGGHMGIAVTRKAMKEHRHDQEQQRVDADRDQGEHIACRNALDAQRRRKRHGAARRMQAAQQRHHRNRCADRQRRRKRGISDRLRHGDADDGRNHIAAQHRPGLRQRARGHGEKKDGRSPHGRHQQRMGQAITQHQAAQKARDGDAADRAARRLQSIEQAGACGTGGNEGAVIAAPNQPAMFLRSVRHGAPLKACGGAAKR